MADEPGPDVVRAGQDQRTGLVDRLGPLRASGALGHHQRPDRLHLPIPAPGRTPGPAGLRGPGRADRIQWIRFAVAPPVLPVRTVHLDDADPGRGHVPGQAGAVTAGPLDPDQADRAEALQPAQ
jgi:hypothetical protein